MTPGQLKKLRLAAGWTQARLASELGLPAAGGNITVCRWEAGARRIPEYIARLAGLLLEQKGKQP